MTTTKTLTDAETQAIAYAARRAVGTAWDYLKSDTLQDKIAEAFEDNHHHDHRLEVMLLLINGVRYDLCNAGGDTIRKATVTESIDSVMEQGGWIEADGRDCYVDFS